LDPLRVVAGVRGVRRSAGLSSNLAFRGSFDDALLAAEEALSIAEPLEQWRTVLDAFNRIALVRQKQGRTQEAIALRDRSLALALENDEIEAALRAYNNRADIQLQQDQFAEALAIAERGIELARSRGDRRWEELLSAMTTTANVGLGRWNPTPELDETGLPRATELVRLAMLSPLARVQAGRGEQAALRRTLALATEREGSTSVEYAAGPAVARAIALRELGQDRDALQVAMPIAIGSVEVANEDLREADQRLATAVAELRAIEAPFNLGQVLLEHAEVRRALGNEEEAVALLAEARSIFERMAATPWIERVDAAESAVAA
jgi:tetratricopeptide (TPR) repeat protein